MLAGAGRPLFGGWGAYEKGWEQLGPCYDWASARFAGGDLTFEEIARNTSEDLAYTVHIERSQIKLSGSDQAAPMALRVTHIYRREDGSWRLLHRHADPIASIQSPAFVIER